MVEAGGIEPPSESVAAEASTRVALPFRGFAPLLLRRARRNKALGGVITPTRMPLRRPSTRPAAVALSF